jgi:transcriptional regulator with XRE-family HTH domain
MPAFLSAVFAMRRASGLTQAELARRLGTSQSVIARWETGRVSPSLSTVQKVARACRLEPQIVWSRLDDVDRDQIAERLNWTPRERLAYLLDMLAFEARARGARLVAPAG